MKLIVGLGNPGTQFNKTRHNVGFEAIDKLVQQLNVKLKKSKFNGLIYKGPNYIIAKPTTFMNLSGDFVLNISSFYNIKLSDILVIYDDIDCKIGNLKFKNSGGHNGQNGIKDIIFKLQTPNFNRIKIGIGRPTNKSMDIANYVLGKYDNNDKIANSIDKAKEAAIFFINNSFDLLMNKFSEVN